MSISVGEALFRPSARRGPAPILICIFAWAVLSALLWAAITLVIYLA